MKWVTTSRTYSISYFQSVKSSIEERVNLYYLFLMPMLAPRSALPLDCDPAYAPPSSAAAAAAALGSAPTDEAGRRSDSLPLEARPGGSLTGQASMCSQTSQPIMPPKPPPSSFATIASRLAPQDSVDKSPRLSLSSVKSQHSKELPVKARVC